MQIVKFYCEDEALTFILIPHAVRIKKISSVFIRSSVILINESYPLDRVKSDVVYIQKSTPIDVDFDFSDRRQILEFIIKMRSFPAVNKTKTKRILSFSFDEFLFFIKISIALGRWYNEYLKGHAKIYSLFESSKQTGLSILSKYFDLREFISDNLIFSSFITFLNKVKLFNLTDTQYSDYYYNLLKKVSKRFTVEDIQKRLKYFLSLDESIPMSIKYIVFFLSFRSK